MKAKHLFLLLALFGLSASCYAQFYNNGAQVIVANNGLLTIKGDLINQDSSIYNDGKIIVEGNCTINTLPTSRIFTVNGDSLVVYKDFQDGSLFGQNSGILALKGTNQSLSSSSGLLANLALLASGDKTIQGNVYVRFNLDLQSGHIMVPTTSVFGIDSTGSISPAVVTSNSFVVGKLHRKKKVAVDSLFFPIGDLKTAYRPATLAGIATPTGKYPVFSINTLPVAVSPIPGEEVTTVYKRYWNATSSIANHAVANIRLYYQTADVASAPSTDLVVAQSTTASGIYNSIGAKSATSNYVLSEFSPTDGFYAIGSSLILKANFKLFLEGPFSGGSMTSSLFSKSILKDSLLPKFPMLAGKNVPTDAVDRVGFVLQKNAVDLDTAYAWLIKDGTIRDYATGERSYVTFKNGAVATSYNVIVIHRNHLPAASTSLTIGTATPPPSSYSFDYTQGVLGGGAMYDANFGVWKLYASDPYKSDEKQTDVLDLLTFKIDQNDPDNVINTKHYRRTDLNLDGNINAGDNLISEDHNAKLYFSTLP